MEEKNLIPNTILEITLFVLTILLAALLGLYVAQITTSQINNELTKFIIQIPVGLWVGVGVAVSVRYVGTKLELIFTKQNQSKT